MLKTCLGYSRNMQRVFNEVEWEQKFLSNFNPRISYTYRYKFATCCFWNSFPKAGEWVQLPYQRVVQLPTESGWLCDGSSPAVQGLYDLEIMIQGPKYHNWTENNWSTFETIQTFFTADEGLKCTITVCLSSSLQHQSG